MPSQTSAKRNDFKLRVVMELGIKFSVVPGEVHRL